MCLLPCTDRVMTLSLHKYGGGFFPGTGDVLNVGRGAPPFRTAKRVLQHPL